MTVPVGQIVKETTQAASPAVPAAGAKQPLTPAQKAALQNAAKQAAAVAAKQAKSKSGAKNRAAARQARRNKHL